MINKIKNFIKLNNLDGYVVPKNDEFFTEYSKKNNFAEEPNEDFEFNQDIDFGEEARSPGWIRYQKKLNDK